MVHTVQKEMQQEGDRSVGQIIINVEEEAMEGVLQYGPHDVPDEEAC